MNREKIEIIGHVGHGKTTLAAAIINVLAKTEEEAKTINQILKESNAIPFKAPAEIQLIGYLKSGKENRRARRAKERAKKV